MVPRVSVAGGVIGLILVYLGYDFSLLPYEFVHPAHMLPYFCELRRRSRAFLKETMPSRGKYCSHRVPRHAQSALHSGTPRCHRW